MANPSYLIGCPVWACPAWKGSVYPPRAPRKQWLSEYSSVFNTVEGNSTFYALPTIEIFEKWASQSNDGFQFCLKFPRAITHDKQLLDCQWETDQFLKGLEILSSADRLGPTFLQFGPSFGPNRLRDLATYLNSLPDHLDFAVEVRHPDWFRDPDSERLENLLRNLQVDRVIFDSRPLFSSQPEDDIEVASQQRKPRVPIIKSVTGHSPMLRLVGRNDLEKTTPWINEWVPMVADWIEEGLRPVVFTHAPDDRFAPEFARRFHNALCKHVDGLEPMSQWPYSQPIQKELF